MSSSTSFEMETFLRPCCGKILNIIQQNLQCLCFMSARSQLTTLSHVLSPSLPQFLITFTAQGFILLFSSPVSHDFLGSAKGTAPHIVQGFSLLSAKSFEPCRRGNTAAQLSPGARSLAFEFIQFCLDIILDGPSRFSGFTAPESHSRASDGFTNASQTDRKKGLDKLLCSSALQKKKKKNRPGFSRHFVSVRKRV